ncbi:MAG: tetratricopeptide repeat protein, partial [Acidobacteria bacterium]|nr:tetratricopeptide repeat protein [Acidobacteriota bacterium]
TPGADVTPIRQAGFDPSATDRWSETWFPIEGIGGLTDASRDAALFAKENGNQLRIGINAFVPTTDTLRVWSGGRLALERAVTLAALEPFALNVPHVSGTPFRVELRALGIDYNSDPTTRRLSRPFESDKAAVPATSPTDALVFEARELIQARRYEMARPLLEKALAANAWHHDGLLAMADLEYRRARFTDGLAHINRALRVDAYDASANFIAGNLYRALGRLNDAREAFGWASRSTTYRSAANVQLADLALGRHDWNEADRYAHIALDYNRLNLSAWEVIAIAARHRQAASVATSAATELLALDPLNHLVRAERYLAAPSAESLGALTSGFRSEFPDQSLLELAIGYANRGQSGDAVALLDATATRFTNPLLRAWRAYLKNDPTLLAQPAATAFVFPYRIETLPVLTWVTQQNAHWSWTYLRALNLWGFDRADEARQLLTPLANTPDNAAFYITRGTLIERAGGDAEPDMRRATELAGADRTLHIPLIQYYQTHGRWADALAAAQAARQRFPRDFNLDLLAAKSFIRVGRGADALSLLGATKVLPSEHARESHQLYVQAHVLEALAAINAQKFDDAREHITMALEWPEHLGQGRPYVPEERLLLLLSATVAQRQGRTAAAHDLRERVAASTKPEGSLAVLDLLAIPALKALGRTTEINRVILTAAARPTTDKGVAAAARALAAGTSIDDIAKRYPQTFSEFDASLVLRALRLQR